MSKRAQLVCQHLENISRAALEQHQDIVRRYVRGRQGVYALYRKGKLYYVGLAANLRNRLKQHLRDRHGQSWDRFSVYLTIGDHHLRELEALMLRVMKPTGNKQQGKFAKSEDLRRSFRRAIKFDVLAELDGLFGEPKKARISRPPRSVEEGRRPTLAKYVSRPLLLKGSHKGHALVARVRRDGRIRFAGKLYTSPSLAGKAARGGTHAVNGWVFWKFERAPGTGYLSTRFADRHRHNCLAQCFRLSEYSDCDYHSRFQHIHAINSHYISHRTAHDLLLSIYIANHQRFIHTYLHHHTSAHSAHCITHIPHRLTRAILHCYYQPMRT